MLRWTLLLAFLVHFLRLDRQRLKNAPTLRETSKSSSSTASTSLVACVSRDKRGLWEAESTHNKDTGLAESQDNYIIVAVADGVSAGEHSRKASAAAISALQTIVGNSAGNKDGPLGLNPAHLYDEIVKCIRNALDPDPEPGSASTTLIGLIETPDRFTLTHLADGSIYQVYPDDGDGTLTAFPHLNDEQTAPPQVGFDRYWGQPKIRPFLKDSDPADRNNLWIIATDGMNDLERYFEGNTTPIMGKDSAIRLAEELRQSYVGGPDDFKEDVIGSILESWVMRCQTHDDATIAVLISGGLLDYWQSQHVQRPSSDHRAPVVLPKMKDCHDHDAN